jgi:flavin-dependent dehydrogenase
VSLDQHPAPAIIVASRAAFDGALLASAQALGATLVRTRVADVERSGNGFLLRAAEGRTWRAAALVGADGPNSLVRRRLLRPFRRDQLSVATGFFAHGVTSDEIVIEITTDPPGYIWSFPRPDHLAIGMCAQADSGVRSADLADRCRRWIDATGIARGAALQRYSWPIPSLSASGFDELEVAGPGFVLVGDAAGLVDPITREGIVHALHSGAIAADALLSTGARAQTYRQRVRGELLPELSRAARFKAGFFKPRFTGLLLRALERSEQVRRVMADLVAGEQSYRGLEWRLARTLELGLIHRLAAPVRRDR